MLTIIILNTLCDSRRH